MPESGDQSVSPRPLTERVGERRCWGLKLAVGRWRSRASGVFGLLFFFFSFAAEPFLLALFLLFARGSPERKEDESPGPFGALYSDAPNSSLDLRAPSAALRRDGTEAIAAVLADKIADIWSGCGGPGRLVEPFLGPRG